MSDTLARYEQTFHLERYASTQLFDGAGSWLRPHGGRMISYASEGAV
jgi:hypothetical protein